MLKTLGCLVAAAALVGGASAQSTCFGSETFKSCTDSSGNSYTITKFGNSTHMQGSNARTGNTWNQQSYTFGNTTQTYGNSADGNSWNMTQNSTPFGTHYYGTDSDGNSFSGFNNNSSLNQVYEYDWGLED